MLGKLSINTYLLLITLFITGLWLSGALKGNANSGEISGADLLLTFVGFLLVLGSVGAFFWLIFQQNQLLDTKQEVWWRKVRELGKKDFIRKNVAKVCVYTISIFFIICIFDYFSSNSLVISIKIYGLIAIVIIGSTFLLVSKMWDYFEQQYKSMNYNSGNKKNIE